MAYLIKTVETYRVASEKEANEMIKAAQGDNKYTLLKSNSEYRCTKAKGEVVDEWYRVSLTKQFQDEKEPCSVVNVEYDKRGSFPVSSEDEDEY